MFPHLTLCLFLAALSLNARGQDQAAPAPAAGKEAALQRLKLPGITINAEERSVDLEAVVCLRGGLLELVACTKDTKEHESIVAVAARPMHIHTALLLLGGQPGNPAMRKEIGEGEERRFVLVPPRGGPVDVSLVIPGKDGKPVERPIRDFIVRSERYQPPIAEPEEEEGEKGRFPSNTFLFAGSILQDRGEGKPRGYLCDQSGNVISLSTFGDELLCLPGQHGHANGALAWQVDGKDLPAVGKSILLRLRPGKAPQPEKK